MNRAIYRKLLKNFFGFNPKLNYYEFRSFPVNFSEADLSYSDVTLKEFSKTYVLIRKLVFHPDIKLNKMSDFKSLLKFKELNLSYFSSIRSYPLGFEIKIKEFGKEELCVQSKTRINEEIVQILPYIKKLSRKILFKVPITKKPLYKSYFSREEMRIIREKTAEQNKTGWSNIEIFEIYSKFYYNFFSNIKQIDDTKNIECFAQVSASDKFPDNNCFLIFGKRRDNNEKIKAIVRETDIKNKNLI